MHGSARGQDQLIDPVSFDQRHVPYPLNRIEDHNVSLVHKGDVFVRFDEDKRDTLYCTFQFSCNSKCPFAFRYMLVAENIDLHLIHTSKAIISTSDAPFLVAKILKNDRHGARTDWLSRRRLAWRLERLPFSTGDPFAEKTKELRGGRA